MLPKNIDAIIRYYLLAGIFWLLVSSLVVVITRLYLVFPAFLPGMIDYGHLRPIYTSLLIFGGLLSLFIGLSYFILKNEGYKLPKAAVYVAAVGFQLQQLALLGGVAGILFGFNKGREYGEFVWIVDAVLTSALILFCINILLALRNRKLTVISALIATAAIGNPLFYFLGNFNFPYDLLSSSPLLTGLRDSTLQGIYRAGLLSYTIILPLLVLLYYFVSYHYKVSLYNRAIVYPLLGAIVILTPFSGAVDLVFSAAPTGLQTLGIVSFMALNFALLIGGLNIDFGLRYSSKPYHSDVIGFMLKAGLFLLISAALVRALLAPRFMQSWFALSPLNIRDLAVPAHTYGLLIATSCSTIALQTLNNRHLSARLLSWVLWLFLSGIVLIYTSDLVSSLFQHVKSTAMLETGELAVKEWSDIFFAGTLYQGKEAHLRFLLGMGGLNLTGYLLLAAGSLLFFLQFFPGAISSNSTHYQRPNSEEQ